MFKRLILVSSLICFSAFSGDLPDRTVTPGALNSAVTQENIDKTICISGYTGTIRPPASYTTKLKTKQLASGPYAVTPAKLSDYEEDHLVSLEIGGNPTDEKNLWPQLWNGQNGAHKKDTLENKLHKLVCSKKITLKEAQDSVMSNWLDAYIKYVGVK